VEALARADRPIDGAIDSARGGAYKAAVSLGTGGPSAPDGGAMKGNSLDRERGLR
jgi:hypothetical protein